MLIYSMASLALGSESLRDALNQIAEYARRHLIAADRSEVSISIGEKGARLHQVVATLVPSDTAEFYIGMPRVGTLLTAAEFLESVGRSAPKRTHSLITLKAAALRDPFALCDELSAAVSASSRGVTLLLVP